MGGYAGWPLDIGAQWKLPDLECRALPGTKSVPFAEGAEKSSMSLDQRFL